MFINCSFRTESLLLISFWPAIDAFKNRQNKVSKSYKKFSVDIQNMRLVKQKIF